MYSKALAESNEFSDSGTSVFFSTLLSRKFLIYYFLLAILVYNAVKIYSYGVSLNGWTLGDWLINYSDGGFKRRGLSGSMLFILEDITGLKLNVLIEIILVLLYFLFFLITSLILSRKKISLLFFSLIISPLTFLFYINDNAIIGRKEILVFAIFSFFLYQLTRGKLTKRNEWLILASIFIATFFHEMMFFFTPYFIIALYICNKKTDIRRYSLYFTASLIPLLLIVGLGGKINEGNTYRILIERGIDMRNSSGILDWPNDFNAIHYIKIHSHGYLLYGFSLLLGIMQFGFYVWSENRQYFTILKYGFLAALIFTAPMFLFAIDYGRWLNIHFMLLLLLCIYIMPEASRKFNYAVEGFNKKIFLLAALIVFNLFWKLEHINTGFEIHQYKFQAVKKMLQQQT